MDFGSVPVGVTNPSPRSASLLNQDPNNVLLGVTAGGANPADFQLVSGPALGAPLSAGAHSLKFTFTPSAAGAESATYTLQTTDGDLTLTLTGTGTSPVSLASPALDFGSEPVGTASPSDRSTSLLNQDPNNELLAITPSGVDPADFQLISGPAIGAPLIVGAQTFRFAFTPSVVGAESATYTLQTTDGNLTVTLTGAEQ